MGTYTELAVNGYDLISTKSAVAPSVMTIFRESDRKEFEQPREGGDNGEVEMVVRYECSAGKIIDRLEVMGFTLVRAQAEFEQGLKDEVAQLEDSASDCRKQRIKGARLICSHNIREIRSGTPSRWMRLRRGMRAYYQIIRAWPLKLFP